MRLPRVRLTVRRLMVAVAVVGLLIGGSIEFRRLRWVSLKYAERVMGIERQLAISRRYARSSREEWLATCRRIERTNRDQTWFKIGRPHSPDLSRKLIPYWESMRSKYERAARYPWIYVEPDPPRPSEPWLPVAPDPPEPK